MIRIDFNRIEINGDLVSDEKQLVELFYENYINIVYKSSSIKHLSVGNSNDSSTDESNVKEIINAYSAQTSLLQIKNDTNLEKSLNHPKQIALKSTKSYIP